MRTQRAWWQTLELFMYYVTSWIIGGEYYRMRSKLSYLKRKKRMVERAATKAGLAFILHPEYPQLFEAAIKGVSITMQLDSYIKLLSDNLREVEDLELCVDSRTLEEIQKDIADKISLIKQTAI